MSLLLTATVLLASSQFAVTQDNLTASGRAALPIVEGVSGHSVASGEDAVLYPGWGTTINGKPVYVSALLDVGDDVQTTGTGSEITVGSVDLDIAPNTNLSIGEPLILNCGKLFVRSGTV